MSSVNSANKNAIIKDLIEKIQTSRKYQHLGLPEEILRDLLEGEMARYGKPAQALKSARAKLHNIMAPYLGDLDYDKAEKDLRTAFDSGSSQMVKETCASFLRQHDSTRERLDYLQEFYEGIFSVCGQPESLLDLACGLNPFALPWMNLPKTSRFYTYDIHPARIKLINEFFELSGREALGEVRDVLVRPPEIKADAIFLFKEAHRMEKRRKGCSRTLWAALKFKYLFVSLPNRSLDGRRDLRERMRALITAGMDGKNWEQGELEFPGETVYWMRKDG